MATMNNTTGAVFIPEVWAKEVELTRDKAYVMADLVERKHEDGLEFGSKVNVPFVGNLAAADDVTAGTPLTPVAPTETEVEILIDKHKAKAVQISDKLKKQSKYPLAEIYGAAIGRVLARAVDVSTLSEMRSGTTNTPIDATTGATYANVVSLFTGLDVLDVPMDQRRLAVNGKLLGDLRQMAEFTRYDATGKENPSVAKSVESALVGWIYGAPVYITNNVEVVAGSPAKDWNFLFHKSAVGLCIQKTPTMEKDRTALNLADDIVGSMIYGTKTLRPDHSIGLKRN